MVIIYLKKRILTLLFIILSLSIFCNEEKQEFKIRPILIFSGTQGFYVTTDSGKLKFLNLEHDLFLSLEIPIRFYTLGIWVEDDFITDFSDVIQNSNSSFQKMLNNSLSAGLDNTFFFKNIIYANLNFNLNFSLPYNQYKIDDYTPSDDKLFLLVNPLIKLGGTYFFGLDWEIEQDIPVKLIFNTDASAFKPNTNFSLSYEFFRFYGPKDFKFSITTNDSLAFSIPFVISYKIKDGDDTTIIKQSKTLLNNLSAGFTFNFFNFSPSINFLYNFVYDMDNRIINTNELGFAAGFSYTYRMLTFSIGYTGYMKYAETYNKWVSIISTAINVNLSTK